VGQNGKLFEFYKFRSMRTDVAGAPITTERDPRITRVGRFLRRSKLDELPQLFNVLKGDLSLVGPRPDTPHHVATYPQADREFLQRFRPGITDPATVRFRNEEVILASAAEPERAYLEEVQPQKLRIAREYLEGASFASDLGVLIDTVDVILRPSRASEGGS